MKKPRKFLVFFLFFVAVCIIVAIIFHEVVVYTSNAYIRANWAAVSPRVKGHVKAVHVQNKAFVKKGQLVIELEEYPYQLVLNVHKATLHDFAWGTRQTRQALKNGLACVLSVLLMYFLDLKEAYWAGISTLIMMQPNVAASLRKGWMRAGGACCGCFMAVIMTGLFLQQHLTYTLLSSPFFALQDHFFGQVF